MKEKISSKILNGLVIMGIILTILALISIPLVLTAFFKTSGMKVETSNMEWILTAFIYLCAVPYLIALFKFKRICKLLTSENSFSPIISKEFQTLAILSLIPLIVVIFISITVGFLFLIMSNIFKVAAEIKEENDLTF